MSAEPPAIAKQWGTRAEAAEYLRESTDSVDRRCIRATDHKERVRGKIRYRLMPSAKSEHSSRFVRLWWADVVAILEPLQ